MDKAVAQLNIEHYRKLLCTETDPTKRATLGRLLVEEEAKLAALMNNVARQALDRDSVWIEIPVRAPLYIPQRRTNHILVRCVSVA